MFHEGIECMAETACMICDCLVINVLRQCLCNEWIYNVVDSLVKLTWSPCLASQHALLPHIIQINNLLFDLHLRHMFPFPALTIFRPALAANTTPLTFFRTTFIVIVVAEQKAFALHAALLVGREG